MKPTSVCRWVVSFLGLLCTPNLAQGAPAAGPDFSESSLDGFSPLTVRDDDGGGGGSHVLEKRAKPFALRILPLGASIVYGYLSPDGNS